MVVYPGISNLVEVCVSDKPIISFLAMYDINESSSSLGILRETIFSTFQNPNLREWNGIFISRPQLRKKPGSINLQVKIHWLGKNDNPHYILPNVTWTTNFLVETWDSKPYETKYK
jgi:hypothetical protein